MDAAARYPGSEYDSAWQRLVWPESYTNPKPAKKYHIVVIGAGPAGLVTAIAAAGLGAKVALIERSSMGGDCLNVGCVPSKALLEVTKRKQDADFESAFAWLREVRAGIAHHDSVERYTKAGVDVFLGEARFAAEDRIVVDGAQLHTRRAVIATGARAALPPIPGLADARPLTNESIFNLRELPSRLTILGAGPIGCEMAQVFSRLGSRVEVLERASRLLPTEHEDASRIVQAALESMGVSVGLDASIAAVERGANGIDIHTGTGTINTDELLVAAGRRANTESLDLDAAGVKLTDTGLIAVDEKLRTSNPKIFAAGDVCSHAQFTHNADAQARAVVQNALFVASAKAKSLVVPHCTYTEPEVAQVGPHRFTLDDSSTPYDAYRVEFSALDRGAARSEAESFAEILTAKGSDEILGATIVGEDAGELLAGVCIAIENGIGLGRLAKTILPYPTRAEYIKRLADAYNRTRLTPTVQSLMRRWLSWTA